MILTNFLPLVLALTPLVSAQRGPLPFKWNTTYAEHGIPFQRCVTDESTPILKLKEFYAGNCKSSPCTINKNTPTLITLKGNLSEPIKKGVEFRAEAWETDMVFPGPSDLDFCGMLLPGKGNNLCPLPKGDVKLQFRMPGLNLGLNIDAQLEINIEKPDHSTLVCIGMHMHFRQPGKKAGEGGH